MRKRYVLLLLPFFFLYCKKEEIPDITACFTYSVVDSPCLSDCKVDFSADCSESANSYTWDFGDGNSGSGVSTSHTYAVPGDYQVSLTITNGENQNTNTQTVNVNAVPVTTFELFQTIGSDGGETGYDHIIDSDGNIVVSGRTAGIFPGQFSNFLYKVTRSTGALAWEKVAPRLVTLYRDLLV